MRLRIPDIPILALKTNSKVSSITGHPVRPGGSFAPEDLSMEERRIIVRDTEESMKYIRNEKKRSISPSR